MENWKPIKGYEGRYEISSLGRVKSLPKPRRKSQKILKPNKFKDTDYLYVDLGNGSTIKRKTIHRLVAYAFLEECKSELQVNHIDGNKSNNNYLNLEWCTRSENQKHSILTGLRTAKGVKNSQCVLTESQVKEIRNHIADGKLLQREIGKLFGVSNITISDIKNGRSWTHLP